MTFEKIHSDVECDCISNAIIDTTSEFVRKLRRTTVEDRDFLTHWEREVRPTNEDCDKICSSKGVSINKMTPETEEQILKKYRTTFNFNPQKGAHYLKFRLNEDAGKVKHTPSADDKSHYNLFKADDFTLSSIIIIETVKFA